MPPCDARHPRRARFARIGFGVFFGLAGVFFALRALPAAAFWDLPRLRLDDRSYALYVAPPGAIPLPEAPAPGSESGLAPAPSSSPAPSRTWPVVLALHGMADRPDWECHIWSETARPDFGFFLCPHGKLRAKPTVYEGKTYPDFPTATAWAGLTQVKARSLGALVLLRARFGAAAGAGPAICVGFSQGAYFSVHLALHHPEVCRAAIAVMPFYRADAVPRLAPGRRPPPLYLVTGTRDVGYKALLGTRDRLAALGYPVYVQAFERLGHDWPPAFSVAVRPAFTWVLANL